MAKTPQHLDPYKNANGSLQASKDDKALVKMGTLKAALAWVINQIPNAGGGLALRGSPDGDIWNQTAEAKPFQISSSGKVHPGLVGGKMPTLGGHALDDAAVDPLDLTDHSGDFKVWFTLNFTVNYLNTFLSSYTLNSVTVDTGTSIPADDDHTKRLQFNTITGEQPSASYFSTSIGIALYDNGANATALHYATA